MSPSRLRVLAARTANSGADGTPEATEGLIWASDASTRQEATCRTDRRVRRPGTAVGWRPNVGTGQRAAPARKAATM